MQIATGEAEETSDADTGKDKDAAAPG